MTDAAAMQALLWSPPTTARCGRRLRAEPEPVDQADRRAGLERREGPREQAQVGAVEAVAVDGGRARDQHHHLVGLAHDRLGDAGADVGREALRVVEVAERAAAARAEPLEVEAHRRDDEGAREAAAAGLVGAGDAARAEPAVVGEEPCRRAAAVRAPAVSAPRRP